MDTKMKNGVEAPSIEPYIGVKLVQAFPENQETIDEGVTSVKEGYAVIYEDGYKSWSPKEVFEKAYISDSGINIIIPEFKTFAAHQQRVVLEHQDLVNKVEALRAFISSEFFKTIDSKEQERLKNQELVMTAYALILKERIENF